jgi:hypothetical protein
VLSALLLAQGHATPAIAATHSLAVASYGQSSLAQHGLLLAQTGTVKTLLGYGLVILGIILGLAVVCRPTDRNKVVKTRAKRVQD